MYKIDSYTVFYVPEMSKIQADAIWSAWFRLCISPIPTHISRKM